MPLKQVIDCEWNPCALQFGGFWTFSASLPVSLPPIELPLASKPRYLHTQFVKNPPFGTTLQSLSFTGQRARPQPSCLFDFHTTCVKCPLTPDPAGLGSQLFLKPPTISGFVKS